MEPAGLAQQMAGPVETPRAPQAAEALDALPGVTAGPADKPPAQRPTKPVTQPELTLGAVARRAPLLNVNLAAAGVPDVRLPARRSLPLKVTIPESWLRDGARPLLIAVDGLALVAGMTLTGFASLQAVCFAVALLALYGAGGLHRSSLNLSILDDAPRLVGNALAAYALTSLGTSMLAWGLGLAVTQGQLSSFVLVAASFVLVGRAGGYAFVRTLRRSGLVAHPTLILGAGHVGVQVGEALIEHPEYGLLPLGFIDSDPLQAVRVPLPVLGGHQELAKVLVQQRVRAVVIAFASLPGSAMVDVIRTCDRMQCEIFIVPRLFEMHHVSHDMDDIWGVPLVRLRRPCYRTRSWRFKRAMDIVVSGAAILVCALPMAVAALAVRLEGGPGVLFRQERVGLDGRRFTLLKFRSLKPVDDVESATNWNISLDDRLGPAGKFLRKSSIDELPQLFNILRGDMSLVGPRPERPHFVDQFAQTYPRYVARHRVPCGLTGWAQIHGLRGDTSIGDRARFDNYYIENWSPWLDTKILIRTVTSVIRGAGA